MISKEFIYNDVLPLVKEKGRILDYYLIQSLFENKDNEIVEELNKYQNLDGGFGHGLEPDVQMPNSSILATEQAFYILRFVKDEKIKEKIIQDIVNFLEDSYDTDQDRFFMVTKEVDDFPHAVWWNFKDLEKNFPFGNPDPNVIGFLYENRKYLKTLNFSGLINHVVDFVMSDKFLESGMHVLMSVMSFYKSVDNDVKSLIHDRIHLLVNKELEAGLEKWDEYSLEPYKIYIIEPHFLNTHLELLGKNLTKVMTLIKNLEVEPNWNWHQYNDVFKVVKSQWLGNMYFNMIRALKLHRII
jgi:hypothetical protein